MSDNYLEAKAVLNDVKSSTKIFVKFRVKGGDVDNSYAHCRLCLVEGGSACRGRASPRTTKSFEWMFV